MSRRIQTIKDMAASDIADLLIEYSNQKDKLDAMDAFEKELRHGWCFSEDPRSASAKLRQDTANKIRKILDNNDPR